MAAPTDKDVLIEVMSPLITGLYSSLDRALELAQQHFIDFDMTGHEYQPAAHHLARAHSRRLLLAAGTEGDLGSWEVAKPKPNLQVLLRNEVLELRLLRPIGKAVPPPGPNPARQAYYTNVHDNLLGIRGSRLLGLWSIDLASGEVSIRVVRPIGTWKSRASAKLDIDFVLPRGRRHLGEPRVHPDRRPRAGFPPVRGRRGRAGGRRGCQSRVRPPSTPARGFALSAYSSEALKPPSLRRSVLPRP